MTNAVHVAPTTGDGYNTLRDPLVPVACWRMDDINFAFGTSFITAGAKAGFAHLALIRRDHEGSLLSLFGHADPSGQDQPNKELSGRRAIAVFATLTRNTGLWESLYSHGAGSDTWTSANLDAMHIVLGRPPAAPDTYATAPARAELFAAYMDLVCRDLDDVPYHLDPAKDFLGKGADAALRGACQGCGEFNPVVFFSRAEQSGYDADRDTTARDADNAPNRRVVGLLFPATTVLDLTQWPCPAPKTGVARCQHRFWSDASTRRTHQDQRRTFAADGDTYACRFYERLLTSLPCNAHGPLVVTRLLLQQYPGVGGAGKDAAGIADLPYVISIVGVSERSGKTAADGGVTVMMAADATATVTVFDSVFHIIAPPAVEPLAGVAGAQRRLDLLGYEPADPDGTVDKATDRAILQYQADQGLDPDGDQAIDTSGKPSDALTTRLHHDTGV
jgi:outer membrane protein OmpA-like peptidoglycan-associated protein